MNYLPIFLQLTFALILPVFCHEDEEYDVIIVGGGTAGSIVATRLSEDPKLKILVLEAGQEPPLLAEIPAVFLHLTETEYDWKYWSTPQKHSSRAFENKRTKWPRGKMLGGSSSMNGLMYVRGNKNDFDLWESDGASGWGWSNVSQYFRKAESNEVGESAKGYLGESGPLKITQNDGNQFVRKIFVEGFQELGHNLTDYNSEIQTGVSTGQSAIFKGQRQSTYKAYIEPVKHRKNLKVVTNALVEKVVIDEHLKATSVVYSKFGIRFTAKARKEIVLSAGTVNSPQLLMLSGIGPKEHLESLNIQVVNNLPVGDNLQDHLMVSGPMFVQNKESPREKYDEALLEYLLKRTGPLADTQLSLAFVNTKYADTGKDWPDLQFMFHAYIFSEANARGMRVFNGYNETIFNAYVNGFRDKMVAIFLPYVLRPKSRGTIRLNSADPQDKPIIDPRYLEEEEDLNVLIEGVKIGFQVGQTSSFKKEGFIPNPNVVPGCEDHELYSDNYWACFVKSLTTTIFHPVGTCRMGSPEKSTSVVDPELKVIGVSGLRVIDASIMPYMVTGNTYAATVMIAEKGSDLIKNDLYRLQSKSQQQRTEF